MPIEVLGVSGSHRLGKAGPCRARVPVEATRLHGRNERDPAQAAVTGSGCGSGVVQGSRPKFYKFATPRGRTTPWL